VFSGIFTNEGHQNTERVKKVALFLTRHPIHVKQMAFSLTCSFFRKIEHAQFLNVSFILHLQFALNFQVPTLGIL
jgi:hypothetical protein